MDSSVDSAILSSDDSHMEQARADTIFKGCRTAARAARGHAVDVNKRRSIMKTRIHVSIAATLAALALAGCSGMTHQEKSTVAGAAIGGVAGSALSGGSAVGTVGGAVAGGVVGHEVGKR
jgi:osmotically inducible lipoprotein OsmB